MSSDKILGTVKWFSNRKGYGFITPKSDNSPTKEDIFVHQSSIHSDGYRTLNEGWEVEFEASPDESGKLKAQNVTAPGGGPCTGPRLRRERKPREGNRDDDEEGGAAETSEPQNGDNGKSNNRRNNKSNGGRSNEGGRSNNAANNSNNAASSSGAAAAANNANANRPKKPQWHDVLDDSVKQSLEAKSIRTTTGTVDVAMGDARVKLGTGGYASLAHATALLAEGTFTCDEHGQVLLEWQRALQAGADGNWNATSVDENILLIKTFNLQDDTVTAVGNDETPESLWGGDKKDPKESLEANGFQMRRVVLTRVGTARPPRNRFRRTGGGSGTGGPPRTRRPPAAAAAKS